MVAATPCDEEFFLRVINAFLFAYTSFVESFRKLWSFDNDIDVVARPQAIALVNFDCSILALNIALYVKSDMYMQ